MCHDVVTYTFYGCIDINVFIAFPVRQDEQSDGVSFWDPYKCREQPSGRVQKEYVHNNACCSEFGEFRKCR